MRGRRLCGSPVVDSSSFFCIAYAVEGRCGQGSLHFIPPSPFPPSFPEPFPGNSPRQPDRCVSSFFDFFFPPLPWRSTSVGLQGLQFFFLFSCIAPNKKRRSRRLYRSSLPGRSFHSPAGLVWIFFPFLMFSASDAADELPTAFKSTSGDSAELFPPSFFPPLFFFSPPPSLLLSLLFHDLRWLRLVRMRTMKSPDRRATCHSPFCKYSPFSPRPLWLNKTAQCRPARRHWDGVGLSRVLKCDTCSVVGPIFLLFPPPFPIPPSSLPF